jgi:hypothetical protein
VGHFILLRQFMDGRIERSDWTGEEAILRPGAYFPDPNIESEWIVTKQPHAIEGERWPLFVIDQIRGSTTSK